MKLSTLLRQHGACDEAREWAKPYDTLQEAWGACDRADWMLWYAEACGMGPIGLTRAACACARVAVADAPPGEDRPLRAIEVVEAWCDGHATDGEMYAATIAAWDASDAAWAASDAASDAAGVIAGNVTKAAAWVARAAALTTNVAHDSRLGSAVYSAVNAVVKTVARAAACDAIGSAASDAVWATRGASNAVWAAVHQHMASMVREIIPTVPMPALRGHAEATP